MSMSAFGIEHGEFSKAADGVDEKHPYGKPSGGRRLAAAAFGEFHPAVAAKPGKKLRATGTSFGASTGLAMAGRMATRSAIGGMAGSQAGYQLALNHNQNKGYMKPESK